VDQEFVEIDVLLERQLRDGREMEELAITVEDI
jgi:hypothetical protein